jgi:beta-glucoside operon transcriptional antiterminator
MGMRILKVINNNVVSAVDDKGQEHMLMGKGIGFRKKAKDPIHMAAIEKRFVLDNQEESKEAEEVLGKIPPEFMQVASDFMAFVGEEFQVPIDYGIYVAVAYHIYEACKRVQRGNYVKNELLLHTMNTYPSEFAMASKALVMVEDTLGIVLPRDEAGFIAIHLVNLKLHGEKKEDRLRDFTDHVLKIVEESCDISLAEMTATYERFLNHLHYLGRRIYEEKGFGEFEEDAFYRQVSMKYQKARHCVDQILTFIREDAGVELPDDEIMYLTIYIQRILLEQEEF